MPQPASRAKPRFQLFSVGKNKPSPARAASTKRASRRQSALRAEALRLPPEFTGAGSPELSEQKRKESGEGSTPVDTPSEDNNEIPTTDMKDTALPPIPQDSVPETHATGSASAPHPRPAIRPPAAAVDARIPPPPPKSGPSRLPQQAAPTMPSSRTHAQASGGPNIFRRLTSKLRSSSTPSPSSTPSAPAKSPQNNPQRKRTALRIIPALPKAPVPAAPPNDFTSREQRQAALRARGLLPASSAYRDANGFMVPLSVQEAELDRRYTVVVDERSAEEQESEAKKIREAWLARNKEAGSALDSFRGSLDVPDEQDELDAARRASRDGAVGDKSPVRATFVNEPAPAEIASPLEATVEDFQTAPNTPAPAAQAAANPDATPRDPPGSPSSHSSAVTEKVSRWLRSSTDAPTPLSVSTNSSTVVPTQTDLVESPQTSFAAEADAQTPTPQAASPSGTVRAKPRKEKPPPIVVTAQRASKEKERDAKAPAQLISIAVAALSDSDTSTNTSDEQSSLEAQARGRQAATSSSGALRPGQTQAQAQSQAEPPLLGHANSSASSGSGSGSRSTTLPALSPTRTVSSFGADSCLPTPTTTSLQRDVSISRGSMSHSSDQSHTGVRVRRGTAGAGAGEEVQQVKAKTSRGAPFNGGIIESSIEETDSSEEGEFGEDVPAQVAPAVVPAARPRPPRTQTAEQAAEAQANRKSFSLFGKKSLDSSIPPSARSSSSMSNLRRAFSSGLASKLQPRPRSSLDPSTSLPAEIGRKRSKLFDASHLPASPTHPPTSFLGNNASAAQGRAPGVGLRPRQAVAPTMHSRGSILHQAHFIEDEESRRLSEMAFLT
ncbi:hypothetical protein C8Q77DRAFT_1071637 [Trametes polyzona]|nr:hypothetical protein C8Q77DRAFT_1071637 [Trametes polyzona]